MIAPGKGRIACDGRQEVDRGTSVTQITRVSRLRGCGVFRNFTWPTELLDFGRYNLVYGWNGPGKTTLSRLFRDLELGRQPEMGEVVLRVDGTDVRGESFSQSSVHIRVFNREFIEENVFPSGRGKMSPTLVLGAENVEKEKQVERLGRPVLSAWELRIHDPTGKG